MDFSKITKEEFSKLYNEEMRKVIENAFLIKKNLENDNLNEEEIVAYVSSYLRILSVMLNADEQTKIEDELSFENNAIEFEQPLTEEDYQRVNSLFQNYDLLPLNFVIEMLSAPTEQMMSLQKRLSDLL